MVLEGKILTRFDDFLTAPQRAMIDHGTARSAALDGAAIGALDQAVIGDLSVFQCIAIVQPHGLTASKDLPAFLVDQSEIVSIVLKAYTPVTAADGAGIVDCQVRALASDRIIVTAFDQTLIVD